jgi:putative hydrolase of the HAD superfamily
VLKFVLFDLDGTLYPRESGLLQEIGRRIQAWLCDRMALTWDEASLLRRDYFTRYGTTLNGLIAEGEVDPHDYLTFVHAIPVEAYLKPDLALAAMLATLPLRRVIYTNATAEHSWRVLRALGVADHFERVISIEDTDLRNKLYRDAYERALALLGAQGGECIMVEDSVRNLQAAKALGMVTVLVGKDGAQSLANSSADSVDYAVENLLELDRIIQSLFDE